MTLRRICLVLFLSPASPLLADITLVGENGGTALISRDCTRGDQVAQCQTDTIYTSSAGEVATKSHLRLTTPGASETEVILTGPEGRTKTRKRLVTWGN